MNEQVMRMLPIPQRIIEAVAAEEQAELERRESLYRDGRTAPDVRHKTVILVDDGLATGSTMRAAVVALRQLGPQRIVVAVPVGSPETCREFQNVTGMPILSRSPTRRCASCCHRPTIRFTPLSP
jgi:putative phosphoribosyl transferase